MARFGAALLVLMLAACRGDGDADPDASSEPDADAPLSVDLEVRRVDGSWVAAAGAIAELQVGVQGLRFIEIRLAARGGAATRIDSMLAYTVPGQPEFTQTTLGIDLVADGDARRSATLRLFFAGSIPTDALRDATANLTGAFTAQDTPETAALDLTLQVRDDDPCLHQPEPDPPLCP